MGNADMTESKWTPGPWLVERHTVYALEEKLGRRGLFLQNRFSALVQGPPSTEASELAANAHLIAIAPEMDDLLGEVVDLLRGDLTGFEWKLACSDFASRASDLRLKARGEK